MESIPLLFIVAIVVTIFELFLAVYLVKKHNFPLSRTLYMAVPTVVILWVVAIVSS
ncbi:hypothetical protein VBD025_03050 [Virgibacillus flavescens]|uniref:hypothetical protein n=1 Tax=Virgibacillus flavescens TaxID=1611422 RepID=UPI003D33D0DE